MWLITFRRPPVELSTLTWLLLQWEYLLLIKWIILVCTERPKCKIGTEQIFIWKIIYILPSSSGLIYLKFGQKYSVVQSVYGQCYYKLFNT